MKKLFLAEVQAYLSGLQTLYWGNHGFRTGPGDTPANQHFKPRIKRAARIRRDLFDSQTTYGRSRAGVGDLELVNNAPVFGQPGELDELLDYAFDGRTFDQWFAEAEDLQTLTFPTDFVQVIAATMTNLELSRRRARINLRDKQAELDVPIQANKYAGNNVLPAGLEGGAELAGKPKPLCLGDVFNVSAVLVNSARQIYQVNDGAVADIPDVRDRGISLSVGLNNWGAKTSQFGSTDIQGHAYGNGVWVAVGRDGKISSGTDDGETWTTRTSGFGTETIRGVRYIEETGMFVAVGADTALTNKTVSTSPDGETWTIRTTDNPAGMNDVAYGNGVYVVVGDDGVIQTSSDLASWSEVDSDVIPDTPLLEALGSLGGRVTGAAAARSTTIVVPEGGVELVLTVECAIRNAAGQTVDSVVSDIDGDFTLLDTEEASATTSRAELWYLKNPTPGTHVITGTLTASARWLISSRLWSNVDQTTPFGTSVGANNTTGTTGAATVASDTDEMVIDVIAKRDSTEAITPDGSQTEDENDVTINVTAGNNIHLGTSHKVGSATPTMQWTWATNRSWAIIAVPLKKSTAGADLYGVVFAQDMFTAVGQRETITRSSDGFSWTKRTATLYTENATQGLNRIIFDEDSERYFVTSFPEQVVLSSQDAEFWTPRPVAFNSDTGVLVGVAAGSGFLLVVDLAGNVSVSTDLGASWFRYDVNYATALGTRIAYGNGRFIAVGTGGRLTVSARPGTYASEADLLNDSLAPAPGTFNAYPAGGLFRLGAPPAGLVTADVVQGATAADRTAGQLFVGVFEKLGKSGQYEATDVTDLDALNDAVCGIWVGPEERQASAVLDEIANTPGAWWGVDRLGVFRIKRLGDPALESAGFTLRASQMIKTKPLDIRESNDPGRGVPDWRTVVRYRKNHSPQETDLAAGVSSANRALYSKQWRDAENEDDSVQDVHPLAGERVYESLFAEEEDALYEAARRQTMRGVQRRIYETAIEMDADTLAIDLGDVGELIHPSFGLSAGKNVAVISLEPDTEKKIISIALWG